MKHLTERDIWSYLDGSLRGSESQAAQEHLAECDLCCERLANLTELGIELDGLLDLEAPSAGFADRVMAEVAATPRLTVVPGKAEPVSRRRSPRYDMLTRFVTAAAVTGFMVFGSTQMTSIPVVGDIGKSVAETGVAVSNGTKQIYAQFQQLIHWISP